MQFSLSLLVAQTAESTPFRWSNVSENRGLGLSLVGMSVVFLSLSLIALFIAALPKVLDVLDPWLPKLYGESHAASPPTPAEASPAREKQVVAAIGYVLHQELQKAQEQSSHQ